MKQPTYFILVFCVLLSTSIGFGQDYFVSGKVVDIENRAVSYATVLVLASQDSTIVKGVSTDDDGFYKIESLAANTYILKVSFVGFNDVLKTLNLTKDEVLSPILLEESSEMLDEVNIIAKRPTLKKEADRLVFNIENTALVEGNMFQVLKSTPGILVIDNNIQVKNSTPTVYINNKKVHLSSDELVQLLEGSSANSIKSVEVITNPSAKYDAVSGAVINIVMSKNLVTGYRGNVFANYTQGVFPKYDGGMSHFFKNEKIDFFANYTYSDKKINRNDETTINYLDANQRVDQIWKSNINRNTYSKTHNFNFNFDYSFDDKNSLSLSSNMLWLPYFKYRIANTTTIFDANQNLDFYYNAKNASDDDKYNLGFDVDYIHQFKKPGTKLSFNAHFTTYDYQRGQNVMSDYFDADDTFIRNTAFRTDNNQDTKIYTAQADYTLPLSETFILETGLKTSKIETSSSINQFDINNGIETLDIANSDAFDYNEDIVAGYLNFSKDWEKVSFIAGVRAEQTDVKGLSLSNNDNTNLNYLKWFPTASLSYAASDNFTLYTNYKRSISRPSYSSLNPFRFFLNDNTIVTGNPNLQPVIVNHAVIGTSFFQRYTVEAYYKTSTDNIFELPLQDNTNNILTYTPINIDKTTEFGFIFETYFDVVKNWSVYFVTSFFNTKDEGDFGTISLARDQWTNYTVLSNDFTFLKDQSLNANFAMTYLSKNQQGFVELDHLLFSDLTVSKTILKKKGTISLAVSDLFNTQDFRTQSRYLNQFNSGIIDQDTRTIKLGFRYKFGNTRLETNERTKAQQETKRLEKAGN